ncbi:MAG: YitT family protein, partial [Desulfobacterota bacterium]|nr:YitT family protein [Thermodesulfobacteriota bacterium]
LFTLEMALYTLIYLYISSYILNLVVTGLNQRKAVYVISPQWKEISQEIMKELERGVTILKGEGGYTGKDQHVLYTVITFRELSRLKGLIRQTDPDAFVVVKPWR